MSGGTKPARGRRVTFKKRIVLGSKRPVFWGGQQRTNRTNREGSWVALGPKREQKLKKTQALMDKVKGGTGRKKRGKELAVVPRRGLGRRKSTDMEGGLPNLQGCAGNDVPVAKSRKT